MWAALQQKAKSKVVAFVGFCIFQTDFINTLSSDKYYYDLCDLKRVLCKSLQIEAIVDKMENCKINQRCEIEAQNLWSIIPHLNVNHYNGFAEYFSALSQDMQIVWPCCSFYKYAQL